MKPSFFKNLGPINIENIQSKINCIAKDVLKNDFESLVRIELSNQDNLTFVYDNEDINANAFENTTVLCSKSKANKLKKNQPVLIVDNVHQAVSVLSNVFYRDINLNEIKKLPKPVIGKSSLISKNAIIENGVVIGNNVIVNDGCFIGHNCVIGNNSKIDQNTIITNSIIGENVCIGRNASIGQYGFGFAINNFSNERIYHIGRVILQSHVNIGSNCTIDRGSFSDTIIGENTYFDNLCHVAHNVQIGVNCAFAAMTGIAGSTVIGDNVMAGGQTGIIGHIEIENNVNIAAKSGVFSSVGKNQTIMGIPAINKFKYLKNSKKTYE